MPARVLIADDDLALRELMGLTLGKEGFEVTTADSAAAVRRLLGEGDFDLMVCDIYLGDATALDVIDEVRQAWPGLPIILVTAQGTIETTAAATAAGVFDYLAKPFPVERLVERVRAALLPTERGGEVPDEGPASMIIGSHPSIVEVYKAVARVARLPVPVLIRGETGTGKELVARALHRFGARPDGPWVAVNCAAIPESLLESELFGHRRGAFTGAVRDHRGAIESAAGGTLFLDEVGELPPLLQGKLLRFLQEGEIRPVGAERSVEIEARVVSATHQDLARAVEDGRIRPDFLHRIAAYEIVLPPLRERTSDLPALVEHFRRRFAERLGRSLAPPSAATLERLAGHPWPGNVRQLENLIQRAFVDLDSLSDSDGVGRLLVQIGEGERPAVRPPGIGDDLTLEELERRHIEAVLRRCRGNRTRAAAILGIERKSLYRKAERLGIALDPDKEDPS
jgi:DNA-binding NtrC family response regulator